MLIYSVMLTENMFEHEYNNLNYEKIDNGFVSVDSNQQIQQVISTNLSAYLKYIPGKSFEK